MAIAIEIQNLTFTYPGREKPALDGINLTVPTGAFAVLCGPSGCGKTTLLRQLKPALAPHGSKMGTVIIDGKELSAYSPRKAAAAIGFVLQNPENQTVTDKVWHELAFGLESLGFDTPTIRLRVAEMASFFGIQDWFYKNVSELSGGQKQLLSLASVMALQPSLLILDEPTAQLDPIAASDFLAAVGKINRELGMTVLLTEHRLEEAFPLADRVIVMEEGHVCADGTPCDVADTLRREEHSMFDAMPVPMRVWAAVESDKPCPVTVRDGREWLNQLTMQKEQPTVPEGKAQPEGVPAVELQEVYFRYGKDGSEVVKDLTFQAHAGELTCILGGNGTGKTTALSLISGLLRPLSGRVLLDGQDIESIPQRERFHRFLAMLPQNPQTLFAAKTVREDLLEVLREMRLTKEEQNKKLADITKLCRLQALLECHPYDLSGGEQQRAALAKVLLLEPRILLLDEPTKGLDADYKHTFAAILRCLTAAGAAVIMVSHDIEFCAAYADRCALFFDGGIVTQSTPRDFFSGNSFYTSAANRMARHILPEAITASDIIEAFGGTVPPQPELPPDSGGYSLEDMPPILPKPIKQKLSTKRIAALCGTGSAFLLTVLYTVLYGKDIFAFIGGGSEAVRAAQGQGWKYVLLLFFFAAEAVVSVLALTWKRAAPQTYLLQTPLCDRKLSKRTIAAAAMILFAIPITIFIGIYLFGDRKFYFIALLVLFEAMLPFAFIFEGRRPQARELVTLAVLCAVGVAGRAAFFMLPQFKPVLAVVIIAGVAFGGEAGFLVGAVTAFVSNMFFGQGPWMPWQMFTMGIIGFLAGVLFKRGWLLRSRLSLCLYGGLAAFVLYGGIMNPASVLMYNPQPTWPIILSAYLQGIPFDLVHALATVVFLAVAAMPMMEKLDRVKVKYGLAEVRRSTV
ncbi:MAG: ATP-binding cassette domain-containing protein [Oscillospiraceae bacterium]|jgi:energy-coupling factor transport system ATP-binding protein|nr:ATP-binding cassette domain-containing protein [Oscillospiraceae bacterium]